MGLLNESDDQNTNKHWEIDNHSNCENSEDDDSNDYDFIVILIRIKFDCKGYYL